MLLGRPSPASRPVGDLLREWRQRRRLSQLDLAGDAEVSTRHLSCVETGRALPSREMVLRLAERLDVPLRERNALLVAAGYAPMYGERPLNDPALAAARKAIDLVLAGHEPYPAHVILRYEIEKPLIEGEIEAEDIPALWDEKMSALLGVATRGNFKDGPLQDVHWPEALFGYFPCYTLGALYAAQWFAAIRRGTPDLDARIAAGDLRPVFDWLRENIWSQASRWTTDELAVRASGEPLNAAHFRAHLEARYSV
ncbi:MAG: helix-turn-helix domain-containing protein [Betaproteobacteria bacterium]|nr:MAG: helix-turn-helix domain-containing protein [Betaproteobacteria bacterium]